MERPLRNRVTPFGEIIATPERGTLMGNRGCLHDDDGRILRQSAREAWISCVPTWPGVRRTLMAPARYTELFFLDEPTALAAGHRPCGSCRPDDLRRFKTAWAKAYGMSALPHVAEIDRELRRTPPLEARGRIDSGGLPDGVMVTLHGSTDAWLVRDGSWHRWTPAGYDNGERPIEPLAIALTSLPILAVLSEGYACSGMACSA